jgi:hypothetical protein
MKACRLRGTCRKVIGDELEPIGLFGALADHDDAPTKPFGKRHAAVERLAVGGREHEKIA